MGHDGYVSQCWEKWGMFFFSTAKVNSTVKWKMTGSTALSQPPRSSGSCVKFTQAKSVGLSVPEVAHASDQSYLMFPEIRK